MGADDPIEGLLATVLLHLERLEQHAEDTHLGAGKHRSGLQSIC